RGGGRSSARETTMRVAAAVIAKKWLAQRHGVSVRGYLAGIGDVVPRSHDWAAVEGNPFFWPDAAQVAELEVFMDALRKSGDSVGARVTVVADGVPPGWGGPGSRWGRGSGWWPTACRRAGASRCTASSTRSWPRR